MKIGDYEQARAGRLPLHFSGGGEGWRTPLITSPYGVAPGPQAFLVEGDPRSVSRPHFHVEDQFQVVVAGGGTLGRHRVDPITVHFASRETGYGPIHADDQGLAYLTLRPRMDKGSLHLPESKPLMRPGLPKRAHTCGSLAVASAADLVALAETRTEAVIEPEADHLAAWRVRLPPAHMAPVLTPRTGGAGAFLVVTAGSIDVGEMRLGRLGCVFVDPGEEQPPLSASEEGAEILVLCFPDDASPPGAWSPPA